jgi:F5/8 type C domain
MIRKKLIQQAGEESEKWLDLARCATFEVTSEDPTGPLENALTSDSTKWIAETPGEQILRIRFDQPQDIAKIRVLFEETATSRSQEFAIFWLPAGESAWREVVRQQFNFSPPNTTQEQETFHVPLKKAEGLELRIVPERSGGGLASLSQLLVS